MRISPANAWLVAALATVAITPAAGAQDHISSAPPRGSAESRVAPVSLDPGARVRLATVSGRIVCDAVVEHTDSASLVVEAWPRDRQRFAWSEVQYLWRGERRYRKRGWNAIQSVGVIAGVVGTAVVIQKGKQSESFAPLGWILGVLPMVLGVSVGLVLVGGELGGGLVEITEWQRLPLAPLESASGILPQHVPAVCD